MINVSHTTNFHGLSSSVEYFQMFMSSIVIGVLEFLEFMRTNEVTFADHLVMSVTLLCAL
jgi:hypothetical protein